MEKALPTKAGKATVHARPEYSKEEIINLMNRIRIRLCFDPPEHRPMLQLLQAQLEEA